MHTVLAVLYVQQGMLIFLGVVTPFFSTEYIVDAWEILIIRTNPIVPENPLYRYLIAGVLTITFLEFLSIYLV